MSQTAMIILGFSVIFLATTAGSAIVWFFKRDISDKVNTLIAIQNFPEGAAVALPMESATQSRGKAFLFGLGSGAVEPLFAIVGFFLASSLTILQPWFLAFAAGAMIFVVAEDLIPDSHLSTHPHLGTWGVMVGFAVMMVLDVALG